MDCPGRLHDKYPGKIVHAADAFGALYKFSKWLNREHLAPFHLKHDKERASQIIKQRMAEGKTYLGELDGLGLLECYGFSVLPTRLARSAEEAEEIAEQIGFPVAMKIVSPQITHKSDIGGVVLCLENKIDVIETFDEIVDRAKQRHLDCSIEGVLIQKMADSGEEVILGMNRYPVFGPLLMFGMGGVFVEVFEDVKFGLAPLGRNEAEEMIRGIKGFKLLQGFRGRPKCDIEMIERLLVSLSEMCMNHPEIAELDINPLLVHREGKGATVADCRIMLGKES